MLNTVLLEAGRSFTQARDERKSRPEGERGQIHSAHSSVRAGEGAGDEPRGWGIRWSQVSLLTKH